MASKSGGTMPTSQTIMDANQALAMLDGVHHWSATRVNSERRRGYSVTITHGGRRVTSYRRYFIDAVIESFAKLRRCSIRRAATVPYMKLAK